MRIDGGDLPFFLLPLRFPKSRVTQALLSNFNMDEFVVGKPGMDVRPKRLPTLW